MTQIRFNSPSVDTSQGTESQSSVGVEFVVGENVGVKGGNLLFALANDSGNAWGQDGVYIFGDQGKMERRGKNSLPVARG